MYNTREIDVRVWMIFDVELQMIILSMSNRLCRECAVLFFWKDGAGWRVVMKRVVVVAVRRPQFDLWKNTCAKTIILNL